MKNLMVTGIVMMLVLSGLFAMADNNRNEKETSIQSTEQISNVEKNEPSESRGNARGPIRINSDAGFNATNGVSGGNGTQGNPYVIENWEIDGGDVGNCIFIGNTTKHFAIRNCALTNTSGNDSDFKWNAGLVLYNVSKGMVGHCNITDNEVGAYINVTEANITFRHNNVSDNVGGGIFALVDILLKIHFYNNTLVKNNCIGTALTPGGAIRLQGTDVNTTVINATFINNYINQTDVGGGGSIRIGASGQNYPMATYRVNAIAQDNYIDGGDNNDAEILGVCASDRVNVTAIGNHFRNSEYQMVRFGFSSSSNIVKDLRVHFENNTVTYSDYTHLVLTALENVDATVIGNRFLDATKGWLRIGWPCCQFASTPKNVTALISGNFFNDSDTGGGMVIKAIENLNTRIFDNYMNHINCGGGRKVIEIEGGENCSLNVQVHDNFMANFSNVGIWVHLDEGGGRRENHDEEQNIRICQNTIIEGSCGNYDGAGVFLINTGPAAILNNMINNVDDYGIRLESVNHSLVGGNTIFEADHGIKLEDSDNNTIRRNLIRNTSGKGIHLANGSDTCDNNTIFGNVLLNNSEHGVYIEGGELNSIHHNNFMENNGSFQQGHDNGANNTWDDGMGQGNFWDNYTSRYPLATQIGFVWDTPYGTDGGARSNDSFPLVFPMDFIVPEINDQSDNTAYTGDVYEFACNVTDNIKTISVHLLYWTGNDTRGAVNVSMGYNNTTYVWDHAVDMPIDSLQPLQYVISAIDIYKNWNATDIITVAVVDNDAPVANAGINQSCHAGSSVIFNGTASTDNIGIMNYSWHLTYNSENVTIYNVTPEFAFNLVGEYEVELRVSDAAGLNGTDNMWISVYDVEDPMIFNLSYPDSIAMGETIDISVRVEDISGIGTVNINYTALNGTNYNVTMNNTNGTLWDYVIPGQNAPGEITLRIFVEDTIGNFNSTQNVTIKIIDITIPVANAGEDVKIETGQTVQFNGTGSTDDDGVVNYTWTFSYNGKNITLYGVSPSFKFDIDGEYNVTLVVMDAAGNTANDWMIIKVKVLSPAGFKVIVGPVVLKDGTPVAGATVTLTPKSTRASYTAVTNDTGYATFDALPIGEYDGNISLGDRHIIFNLTLNGSGMPKFSIPTFPAPPPIEPKNIEVPIGPIVDQDGKPIKDATVTIVIDGVPYEGTTDSSGKTIIKIPESASNKTLEFTIEKDGFEPLTFTAKLNETGDLGELPVKLELVSAKKSEEEKKVPWPLIGIIAAVVVLIIILLVVFGKKGKGKSGEEPTLEERLEEPEPELEEEGSMGPEISEPEEPGPDEPKEDIEEELLEPDQPEENIEEEIPEPGEPEEDVVEELSVPEEPKEEEFDELEEELSEFDEEEDFDLDEDDEDDSLFGSLDED